MTREPIYAALFAFFAGLTTGGSPLFRTTTRKTTTWESVAPEDQPALLMRQRSEHAEHRKFMPTKWSLDLDLLVYVHTSASHDPSVVPAVMLNPLLDAIEASFVIDNLGTGSATLGGLVAYASIEGTTQIFLGHSGNEAVAIVPVHVLVNN